MPSVSPVQAPYVSPANSASLDGNKTSGSFTPSGTVHGEVSTGSSGPIELRLERFVGGQWSLDTSSTIDGTMLWLKTDVAPGTTVRWKVVTASTATMKHNQ